jgi:Ca2+-binding RTX toxin-like protein
MLPLHEGDYRSIDVAPSGSHIAYTTDESAGSGMFVVSTNGNGRVTFPGVSGGSVAFSPSGRNVIFTVDSNPDAGGFYHSSQLIEFPVGGGTGTVLTDPPSGTTTSRPAWQGTCTILGEPDVGTIYGTPGNDVICAGAGNHVIYAEAGNDVVYGGSGTTVMHGERGHDVLVAGTGQTTIFGGRGNDVINTRDTAADAAESDSDRVQAGPGHNICIHDTSDVVSCARG